LGAFLGKALPIELAFAIRPGTLLVATAYGLFVSLLFSLWPLGKASLIRPAVLFREESMPDPTWPRWWIIALLALIVAALFAMAIGLSEAKRIAFYFCATLVAIFAVFAGLGHTISFMARRVRRPRRAELALALRNLGAPDGLTSSVVISLGAGLSLIVAVALANASIVAELVGRLPVNSPDYFVLDLPETDLPGFRDLVQREIPGAHINQAPMMRGRLIKLGNRPVEQVKAPPEAQWVLSGDRGLTYAENVPEGSVVVAGEWWAQDYAGPPLVSFESELARMLGLKLGDSVTVNVLGRNLTARIANLRDVRWESLAINFVMVFSPNTLRGAPHNLLATVSLPSGVPLAREASLAKTIGKAYPAVTAIRVKDAINAFSAVFERVMTAIRVAGGVTLLAGALVLAGALATSQRRRVQQSIILKVLGATRARVLLVHFAEYALLALVAGASAILVGSIAAWIAVTRVMELSFVFSGWAVLQALGASLVLVALLGSIGTWRVLRAPPAPHLRSE
jgi:putative ABC transport system permease protein